MTSVSELKSRTAHLPPVDNNVQLPAAIRAAALRASQLHDAAYKNPEETDENANNGNAGADESGTGNEGHARQEELRRSRKRPRPQKKPRLPRPEDWEHKYNSLKGRFDRQEDTIRGLNSRIDQLTALLAAPKQAQEQPPSELKFGKLTDKDKDEFGEDFLDASARAAEERLGPYIRKLEDQVRQLGGSVQNVAATMAQNAQQAMYSYLNDQLPNWREINRDPNFLAWTNLQDPYSGDIRINMLRDAYQKSDGQRVLRFFQGFLKDEAVEAPATGRKPEMPADKAKGKVPLSEFAAPGRAKAPAATDVPGEKETITHAQNRRVLR